MTTTSHEHLMHWLRDAHAMEEQAEDMLAKTASRVADDSPEFASRLRDHASVPKVQAQHRSPTATTWRSSGCSAPSCSMISSCAGVPKRRLHRSFVRSSIALA